MGARPDGGSGRMLDAPEKKKKDMSPCCQRTLVGLSSGESKYCSCGQLVTKEKPQARFT